MTTIETDVLVVGTGIAGLTFALRVAEAADVTIVTKKARAQSNTNYAQGGIAAVVSSDDSFGLHVADTLRAGGGLCHRDRVETLVRNGPAAVRDLIDWGVEFSRSGRRLALGREGGHARPRIVHSQDATGSAIESALIRAVNEHPRIRVFEDHMALELSADGTGEDRRCVGGWILDVHADRLLECRARTTLLATGGCAAMYAHTTNPPIATGDGIAMGYRAGAAVANMEFIQFHPTALYPAADHAFLISEAVRGDGAELRNAAGEPFMHRYDPRGDLAPRDIVARAVHAELRASERPHVWLDATGIPAERLESRFPTILEGCAARGIDIRAEPIPVVPAAHYVCGGLWTAADGATTLPGLFAAGECSCTGVHGANRLASNSLLEAVVFSERAASRVVADLGSTPPPVAGDTSPPADLSGLPADRLASVRDRVRRIAWDRFGILRTDSGMATGEGEVARTADDWAHLRARPHADGDPRSWEAAAEVSTILEIATLIARCARWRRESRGLHCNEDHPFKNNEAFLRDTVILAR